MSCEHEHHHEHGLCIQTNKVYDWCYRRFEEIFQTNITLPATHPTVLITGQVKTVIQQELSRQADSTGKATIQLAKIVTYNLDFWWLDATGKLSVFDRLMATKVFQETIAICAPVGTALGFEAPETLLEVVGVTPPLVQSAGTDVTLTLRVTICQSVQSLAPVKVCIPVESMCRPRTHCEPPAHTCPPPLPPTGCSWDLCQLHGDAPCAPQEG